MTTFEEDRHLPCVAALRHADAMWMPVSLTFDSGTTWWGQKNVSFNTISKIMSVAATEYGVCVSTREPSETYPKTFEPYQDRDNTAKPCYFIILSSCALPHALAFSALDQYMLLWPRIKTRIQAKLLYLRAFWKARVYTTSKN